MARKPPIKKTDHRKNLGKKPESEGNQSLKKDDDTFDSTELLTVTKDIEEQDVEQKKADEKDDNGEACDDMKTLANMIVEIPKKDGDTATLSLASGTNKTRVANNGKLTVIQKSKLMKCAEEQFLRANKIMTLEEATKDVKLHKAASKVMARRWRLGHCGFGSDQKAPKCNE
jgi:hypothetical protein